MKIINIAPSLVLTVWSGIIIGISFIEAWLKFSVPGVTLQIGLSIGMKVFGVVNIIEWLLFAVVLGWFVVKRDYLTRRCMMQLGVVLTILLLQTFWLLPELNLRAVSYINNEINIPKSHIHHTYVIFETVKLVFLTVLSVQWIKGLLKTEKL